MVHLSFNQVINYYKSMVSDNIFCQTAIVWWFVWYIRNQVIFQNAASSFSAAALVIHNFYSRWLRSLNSELKRVGVSSALRPKVGKVLRRGDAVIWVRPPPGFVKLNFDDSRLQNGQSSFGFVVRDEAGVVLAAGGQSLGSSLSILQAEAWGLREGVRAAIELRVQNIIIEGDNIAVINAAKKIWSIPWEIANILSDVEVDLQVFDCCRIFHIFREANGAADFMASWGHQHCSLMRYVPPFNIDFSLIIRKDVLGWPPD